MKKFLIAATMAWSMVIHISGAIASTTLIGVPINSESEIPTLDNLSYDANTETFRLMSYNVRIDHEQDAGTENQWSERAGRVLHVITKYASDLYTFQEPNESQVVDLKRALGDDYGWVHYRASERAYQNPANFENKQDHETQAIAFRKKRFNLIDSGRFWLAPNPDQEPETSVWDASPFSRIAVYAKLYDRISDCSLTIITAHFDHKGIEARKHSVDLMISYANKISEGNAYVLTGDFNTFEETDGSSEIYNKFLEYSDTITDVRKLTSEIYGPVSSWVGWDYNAFNQRQLEEIQPGITCRWDHMFLSNGRFEVARTAVADDRFAINRDGIVKEVYPSDHRPIISDLSLKKCLE